MWDLGEGVSPGQSSPQRQLLFPQQAHIPNSIMAILEASGKQEPETKEAPAGPLEEVRVPRAPPPTHTSHFCREGLRLGVGRQQPLTPGALSAVCLRVVSIFSPPSPGEQPGSWVPAVPEVLCIAPHPQDDLEPLTLAPPPAPRPPQDLIGLRLAQEKALKRQLEEEQKLKPGGLGAPSSSSSSSSSSARPGPVQPEEAIDFREEGPECETPAIFISMDDDSGLTEAALLDSSLEGPLPKVGMTSLEQQRMGKVRARG